MDFSYYDLAKRNKSFDINLLFPNWEKGLEKVAIFAPHDDDAVLGTGFLIQAVIANGGEPVVFIFCDGNAGYSDIELKNIIVEKRKEETKEAFKILGLTESNIIRFNYPDFSVIAHMGWILPGGNSGTFPKTIRALRDIRATRLLIPNRYCEHIDHEAVGRIGAYDGAQAGDEILADWGKPSYIRSFLEYAVWSDFSPNNALTFGRNPLIRANKAIKVSAKSEDKVIKALQEFKSQHNIIANLVDIRKLRQLGEDFIELYIDFEPRPQLNYEPYIKLLGEIDESF